MRSCWLWALSVSTCCGWFIKALRVYINSHEVREEKKATRKSLAEALRENRVRCKMTQEFVSETIGVSRQAVSKWENGVSHS